jgi:DNA-binding transcriptional ArsR family regulator
LTDDPTGRVFDALADPNRRYVVQALAQRPTATATELAAELPVTRQAVSKHLAALGEAGLVEGTREGRETRYRLTPGPLGQAMDWMADVGASWDARLMQLHKHLTAGGSRSGGASARRPGRPR